MEGDRIETRRFKVLLHLQLEVEPGGHHIFACLGTIQFGCGISLSEGVRVLCLHPVFVVLCFCCLMSLGF